MSGNLPGGALYVRIQLNDVRYLPYCPPSEEFLTRAHKNFSRIASVTIRGDHLKMGVTEPLLPEGPTEEWLDSSTEMLW